MPLQKNQLLTLRIERLSSDGSGVAHSADGEAVFVPNTAPGDEARIKIVKDCGRYAFGILDQLLTPSPDRVEVDCPAAGPCGGFCPLPLAPALPAAACVISAIRQSCRPNTRT